MTLNLNCAQQMRKRTPRLVRTFVLTGEPRCQLAAVWSAVAETPAPAEEPSLRWPAWRTLLSRWRAFYRAAIPFRYGAI